MSADQAPATGMPATTDFWSAEKYSNKVAPFVAQLTTRVVEMLNPQPDDIILDVGCGDGVLTAALAPRCRHITGIDKSANLIASLHAAYPDLPAFVCDCSTSLHPPSLAAAEADTTPLRAAHYTAIFSNAALHWILRPPAARASFFAACAALLRPGGRLVAEAGAAGNVAEVCAAVVQALVQSAGVAPDRVRAADPWWFGTLAEYRALAEGAGLEWVHGEVELRQTRLTDGPQGGVRGWIDLFAAPFAALLPGGADGAAWKDVIEQAAAAVEYVGARESDGGMYVNYVRVRFEVRKPTSNDGA